MEKFKNTKKLKSKKHAIDENLANRRHGRKKKDFCQEGENLVNRCLLQFMLHLAAHLLAYHAVAFMLSHFSFSSLMYPWTTS